MNNYKNSNIKPKNNSNIKLNLNLYQHKEKKIKIFFSYIFFNLFYNSFQDLQPKIYKDFNNFIFPYIAYIQNV